MLHAACCWIVFDSRLSKNMAEELNSKSTFKVGTRKSQLAMIQTNEVVRRLEELYPEKRFEVVARTTVGDQRLDVALNKIGEKSLFTKELEICLESGEVDLVVHSLKDLPTTLPEGMVIGAILEREDPRDALVVRPGSPFSSLSSLPSGAAVGTSSVRRAAQIRARHTEVDIRDVRGNLNTRFRKLDDPKEGEPRYDALVLAAAGVKRMGWQGRITQAMEAEECLHAVGQGALAVECRSGDGATLALLSALSHRATALACAAERAFMRRLEGGCSAPVAAHAEVVAAQGGGEVIRIDGGVWSLDGKDTRRGQVEKPLRTGDETATAEAAGLELAEKLLEQGAGEILKKAKEDSAAK